MLAKSTEGGGPRSTPISRFVTRYNSFPSPSPVAAWPSTPPEYVSLLPTGRCKVLHGVADPSVDFKMRTLGSGGEGQERTGELTVDPTSIQNSATSLEFLA